MLYFIGRINLKLGVKELISLKINWNLAHNEERN